MTNNIHSNTFSKTLIATLTILTITGLGAATASSLSLDSDSQEVQPGDSISGEFDTSSTDTDVQVALDIDQDGTLDSSKDTTVTVSSGDISSDTDVSFSSLSVPSGAAEGTADVVAIQQSSSLEDSDDISSPDSSTTTEIDDTDPTTSLTVDDKQVQSDGTVQVSYTVNDENTVDSASLILEDSSSDTLSKSKSDLNIGSGDNTADFDLTNLDSSSAATGEFTVSLDATDEAGNSPDTVSDTGTVDDSDPSVSVDSQAKDVEDNLGTIEGSTSDSVTSISGVDLTIQRDNGDYYTGSEWQSDSNSVSASVDGDTWSYDASGISDEDTYTITATATDAAGNTNTDSATYYTSIQDAVDAANSEDTVLVGSGTYDPVTVDTSDLTIESVDGVTPSIEGGTDDSKTVDITVEGVTVDGFEVRNVLSSSGGDNLVYVDHGSSGETNLSNNEFVADASDYSNESGETEFSVETKSTLVAEGNVFRK